MNSDNLTGYLDKTCYESEITYTPADGDSLGLGDLVKRTFDFFGALVAIVVFLIPSLVIAVMIWMEDRGNPVFSQERVGKGGKTFTLYKFRSMKTTSENDGVPALCADNDSRLTRVGAFIRAHHLDEFPQLWNVLRGDMSFVGYRPERRFFIDRIMRENGDYARLFAIRPGLFSEATLYNGYTDTMEKMLRRLDMDLSYLERRSMLLDLSIIWKTTVSIISGKQF